MNRKLLTTFGAVTLLGLLGACDHHALDPTFGRRYHEVFSVQGSERGGLGPANVRGDEERRIIAAYYGKFAPESGSGSGVGSFTPSASTMSPLGGNPSQGNTGGLDLRAR